MGHGHPHIAQAATDKAELRNFGKADEVREFPQGRVELINVGGATIGRAIFDPGWRWSTSVQPIAKTKSCEAPHFQYHVSGVLRILMDDGSEFDCKPGDVSLLPSGHDAWVVGNEPAVVVDFQALLDATPEYKKMKDQKISATSPEGIKLNSEAITRIATQCETVRASNGYCSVWKSIQHKDGRAITDVTDKVKALL